MSCCYVCCWRVCAACCCSCCDSRHGTRETDHARLKEEDESMASVSMHEFSTDVEHDDFSAESTLRALLVFRANPSYIYEGMPEFKLDSLMQFAGTFVRIGTYIDAKQSLIYVLVIGSAFTINTLCNESDVRVFQNLINNGDAKKKHSIVDFCVTSEIIVVDAVKAYANSRMHVIRL